MRPSIISEFEAETETEVEADLFEAKAKAKAKDESVRRLFGSLLTESELPESAEISPKLFSFGTEPDMDLDTDSILLLVILS
jgi:hypothetical protein